MKISREEIGRRRTLARSIMEKEGVDALVIEGSSLTSGRGWMRYFIDYYVPVFEEYLVLPLDGPVTFFARGEANARSVGEKGFVDQVICIPSAEAETDPGKCVAAFLKDADCFRPALCGKTTALFWTSLAARLEKGAAGDATRSMETARMVKSPEELRLCEEAVRLNEAVFLEFLKGVRPGRREMDAVAEASFAASQMNCEDQFWLVGSGPVPRLCSLPLATEKNHVWQKGDLCSVVIEIAGSGGYYGEVTHLISIGEPDRTVREAFEALSLAHREAEKLIRPGIAVGTVADQVSRCLMDTGYWKAPFSGVMGHGQGLDMSETPMLSRETEMPLTAGTRLNVHPCVNLKNGVGVASCECYTVTEGSARRISALPREFIVV